MTTFFITTLSGELEIDSSQEGAETAWALAVAPGSAEPSEIGTLLASPLGNNAKLVAHIFSRLPSRVLCSSNEWGELFIKKVIPHDLYWSNAIKSLYNAKALNGLMINAIQDSFDPHFLMVSENYKQDHQAEIVENLFEVGIFSLKDKDVVINYAQTDSYDHLMVLRVLDEQELLSAEDKKYLSDRVKINLGDFRDLNRVAVLDEAYSIGILADRHIQELGLQATSAERELLLRGVDLHGDNLLFVSRLGLVSIDDNACVNLYKSGGNGMHARDGSRSVDPRPALRVAIERSSFPIER